MKAMTLSRIASLDAESSPLDLVEMPIPKPQPNEVQIRVSACGVCHTELDEIEGRAAPRFLPIIPGHQIVGRVSSVGHECERYQVGDRIGVGWIHSSSGDPLENLSDQFRATGRDAHGGYAEYATVEENYAYPIPEEFSDVEAAPLLCAGAIGYRALRLANITNGHSLGLTGFGASAHLVLQLAGHMFPDSKVFVFARERDQQQHAIDMGAEWAGDTSDSPPDRLHAIIDTTPAWKPVVCALTNLRPAGRLVINAIRKVDADKSELLNLDYQDHLWMEKEIKSVANISAKDIAEFLPVAAEIPIKPDVTTYPLEQANEAIMDIKRGGFRGARVLTM